MNEKPLLYGVLPVLHTPYHDDETVDFDMLAREVDFVIDNGADGVVLALGSEFMSLKKEERLELTFEVPQMVNGRCTVTVSVGAKTPVQVVNFAVAAQKAGADAVMALPPQKVYTGDIHIYDYFKAILGAVDLPLVIQNASIFTGKPMGLNLQVRLRQEFGDRIYFKPETVPVGSSLSQLKKALGNEVVVFGGHGGLYLIDTYRRGISGLMPGSDLIRGTVEIWRALEAGDFDRAYEVYLPLAAIVTLEAQSFDIFIASAKYLLCRQGVLKNHNLRKPVKHYLDNDTINELARLFDMLIAAIDG